MTHHILSKNDFLNINKWEKLIIFITSIFFSFVVVIEAISNSGINFIILGLPFVFINFFLSKKFPHRFTSWTGSVGIKPSNFFVYPPFSTIAMSTALIIYLSHFIDIDAEFIWDKSINLLPLILETIGMNLTALPVLIILAFILVGPFYIFYFFYKNKFRAMQSRSKYILLTLFLIYSFIVSYLLMSKYLLAIDSVKLLAQITKFVVGFIPIHWFYELFIASLKPELEAD